MRIRDNEYVSLVVRPPARGNKSRYKIILIHQILLAVNAIVATSKKDTKGTAIIVGFVTKQRTPPRRVMIFLQSLCSPGHHRQYTRGARIASIPR
jgi:hypothetical protein